MNQLRKLVPKSRLLGLRMSGVFLLMVAFLIIPFQNCSYNGSASLIADDFPMKARGNGGGYEGKLTLSIVYNGQSLNTQLLVMNSGESFTYQITGGVAPYQVQLVGTGTLDQANSKYTAPYAATSITTDTFMVTDSVGATAQISIEVHSFIDTSQIFYPLKGSTVHTFAHPILVDSSGVLYNLNTFWDHHFDFKFQLRTSIDNGNSWLEMSEHVLFSDPTNSATSVEFKIDAHDALYVSYFASGKNIPSCPTNGGCTSPEITLKSINGGKSWSRLANAIDKSSLLPKWNDPTSQYSFAQTIDFFGVEYITKITNLHWLRTYNNKNSDHLNTVYISETKNGGTTWTQLESYAVSQKRGGSYATTDLLETKSGSLISTGTARQETRSPALHYFPNKWVVFKSDDQGHSWLPIDTFTQPNEYASIALSTFEASNGDLYTLGTSATDLTHFYWTVRRSKDQGKNWQTVDFIDDRSGTYYASRGDAKAMAELQDGSLYVAGAISDTTTTLPNHWLVRKSVNNGNTWSDVLNLQGYQGIGIKACLNTNSLFATATNLNKNTIEIRRSMDGGKSWKVVFESAAVTYFWKLDFACLDNGKLLIFENDAEVPFSPSNSYNYSLLKYRLKMRFSNDHGDTWESPHEVSSNFQLNSVLVVGDAIWLAGSEQSSGVDLQGLTKLNKRWTILKINKDLTKSFIVDQEKQAGVNSSAKKVIKCNQGLCAIGEKTDEVGNSYSIFRILK